MLMTQVLAHADILPLLLAVHVHVDPRGSIAVHHYVHTSSTV